MTTLTIQDAEFPGDAETVRALFREFATWLGVDLGFQNFEAEVANLPGDYVAPRGALLLLKDPQGVVLGCVGMRPLSETECEMKRLYVKMEARGTGLGRALAEAIIERARAAGYRRIVLDTLDHMGAALRLYERLGFQRIAAYYNNPLPGAIYLGRDL